MFQLGDWCSRAAWHSPAQKRRQCGNGGNDETAYKYTQSGTKYGDIGLFSSFRCTGW